MWNEKKLVELKKYNMGKKNKQKHKIEYRNEKKMRRKIQNQ